SFLPSILAVALGLLQLPGASSLRRAVGPFAPTPPSPARGPTRPGLPPVEVCLPLPPTRPGRFRAGVGRRNERMRSMDDVAARFSSPVPDVLGEPWQARTLTLAGDGEAVPPVATLVQRAPSAQAPGEPGTRRAVLYIHGFVDYFFQTHHARTWEECGFTFAALDLRDYGRSIRAGRRPNWTLDLAVYDEEISAAIALLHQSHDEVVLAGHSTGGLIVSLYAARHPGDVAGLMLNSPWLDLDEPWFMRAVAAPVLRRLGHLIPYAPISSLGSGYGESLRSSTGGDWTYELGWKPFEGFGVYAG